MSDGVLENIIRGFHTTNDRQSNKPIFDGVGEKSPRGREAHDI